MALPVDAAEGATVAVCETVFGGGAGLTVGAGAWERIGAGATSLEGPGSAAEGAATAGTIGSAVWLSASADGAVGGRRSASAAGERAIHCHAPTAATRAAAATPTFAPVVV